MNKNLRIGFVLAIAIALISIFLLTSRSPMPADAVTQDGTVVQSRLTSVGYLYALYRESRGRSPTAFEEFVEFGRKIPGPLGPIVFTEEALMLPRDKQLIVIRYGLKLPTLRARQWTDGDGPIFSDTDGPILAHEKTGVNGRRFVVFAGSNQITEMDEETFQKSMRP